MKNKLRKTYFEAIDQLLSEIKKNNSSVIEKISKKMESVISSKGIIYVFGSGHSCIFALEAFHRAGGLVPVHPILYPILSPFESPRISGKMEKVEGIAAVLLEKAAPKKGEVLWIASNSGINAAAIEMAQAARKKEMTIVCITSLKHTESVKSRHSSGKKLFELCDFVLDNCCPIGDVLVESQKDFMAPGSTIANCFLYHWAVVETCERLKSKGKKLPLLRSANLPDSESWNREWEEQYRNRIPLL